jgi:glycosyltransferase involved in cell wall biosynthesis
MHLLIIGGSARHPGGVEAFCDRAAEALAEHDPAWRIDRLATETAYMRLSRIPAVLRQLRELIRQRRQKPDIAWVQYVNLPDLAYVVVARSLGIRVLVTPHLGANWRSQQNPVLRSMSAWLIGMADRIGLLSKTQQLEIALPAHTPRSMLRSFLPAFILRSPPVELPVSSGELRLLHAARLSAEKGTFKAVEVAARLRDAGVSFSLTIAGGAEAGTFEELHALIQQYGLGEQVRVLGRIEGAAMLNVLRESDILVHLSSIDSYPLILLEAIACAILPVAMDLAGARDMIETYDGAIVSATNPVEETAAFLAASDLYDLRQRAHLQSARVRSDYAWEHCAAALADALRLSAKPQQSQLEPAS